MYVHKEVTLSTNIEGAKATMRDSLKADINITEGVPRDVENTLHYVQVVNYGLERLKDVLLTLRVIHELAPTTHGAKRPRRLAQAGHE